MRDRAFERGKHQTNARFVLSFQSRAEIKSRIIRAKSRNKFLKQRISISKLCFSIQESRNRISTTRNITLKLSKKSKKERNRRYETPETAQ